LSEAKIWTNLGFRRLGKQGRTGSFPEVGLSAGWAIQLRAVGPLAEGLATARGEGISSTSEQNSDGTANPLMIVDLLRKAYGNFIVLKHLRGQYRIPYLPEQELSSLRDRRLRNIIKYAAETVPYYKNLFQKGKMDPREIRSVKDLDCLPYIDKEMVRKDPVHFVSTSRRGKNSIPFVTSGTTGMPLKVFHDLDSLLANFAFTERERAVITKICGKPFGYRIAYISYSGGIPKKFVDFYRQWTFIPIRPKYILLNISDPVEEIVKGINRFRPDVIVGYGSYLETFFKILASNHIEMHLPKVLVYGADMMTPEGKSFIEEKFRVNVQTTYLAVEAFKIGFFCEEGRGFHLHEDLCPLKIINAKGDRVKDGEKGEVVISNLVNHGTVLLNYRLGDIGSMSTERCPCGRTLPLLSELEGRVEDIIFLKAGRFIHPRSIWEVMKGRDEILKYQLIQHEPERFELRLVTVDFNTFQRVADGVVVDLRSILGSSASIRATFHEELRSPEGGKFRAVLSLCKPGEFQ
jgi:phenylacetate-CoA ligase